MRRTSFASCWVALLAAACALDDTGTAKPSSAIDASGGSAGSGGIASDASPDSSGGFAGTATDASDGSFVSELHGKRIEIPCGAHSPPGCAAASMTDTVVFEAPAGVVYDVRLRFRGVVEQNAYTGGNPDGMFYVGGVADNAGWNRYSISVTSPAQTYHLNHGSTNILHCFAIDYEQTIPIAGGATVTVYGDAMDGQQVLNVDEGGTPIVIPGVVPAPQAYDGQFIQIDVVSMTPQ